MQTTIISEKEIINSLEQVMDPEVPVLSVVDMGIITEVKIIDEASCTVKMIPTFTACPAIREIKNLIKEKVVSLGFEKVEVEIDETVSWNSDRISERGKLALKNFGLGIPVRHGGNFSLDDISKSACPHCGSNDTTMNSLFGSTLCRSIHFCFSCKQSFERFKPV